jgi:LemA protein
MDFSIWLVAIPIVAVLVWAVGVYNALVRADNTCDESWSGIETELRRRHDLIPSLIETVKGYAAHERQALENVTEARSAAVSPHDSPAAQARDESILSGALHRISALAESYPDLKANHNFLRLQGELATTEDRIQRSRRFYNANVRELANRVEVFPSNLVASAFGFKVREYFDLEDEAVGDPVAVSFQSG